MPTSTSYIAAQTLQRNVPKQPSSTAASPQNVNGFSRSFPREGEGSVSGSAWGGRASMEATAVADRQLFVFCDPVTTHASLHLDTRPSSSVLKRSIGSISLS